MRESLGSGLMMEQQISESTKLLGIQQIKPPSLGITNTSEAHQTIRCPLCNPPTCQALILIPTNAILAV